MTTAAHRPRILVVEDEAIVARDIQLRLQELGYDPVGHAARGEDAVAMARALRPDLVLMDIQLAGAVDGIAAAAAIRAERAVPVVYLTAFAEDDVLERAKLTDPFGYIIKPFADRELRTVLEMALYKHQIDTTLRESEFRWKFAIEGSGDGLWDWNVPAGTVFLSPRWKTMLGFAEDEVGDGLDEWSSRVHPDDLAQAMADVQAHLAGATPVYRNEHRVRCKDGGWKYILDRGVVVARDTGGSALRMIGTHSDVTDRKLAADALAASELLLRDSERQMALSQQLSGTGSWVYDLATDSIWGSAGGMALYGLPPVAGALPIADIEACIPERERVHQALLDLIGEGRAYDLEFVINPADGAPAKTLHSIATLERDADGNPRRVLGFVQDITALKRSDAAKDELEAKKAQIQKAESLGRMAGAVAHIFNNQLQVVVGNLELAITDRSLRPGTVESLTDAMQAAHKAAEVSVMMVAYLAQTHRHRAPLDLCVACQPSLLRLGAAVPRGVTVETDLCSPGPAIRGNAEQIHEALNNLLANAREAIGAGPGAIRLTVRVVLAAEIPAKHRYPVEWRPEATTYACLEVVDTGSGIADQDVEKLFDPFFTTKFTGRGLGLSVVLGIVREHDGAIALESAPGTGSVFRVFLPVTADEIPTAPVLVAATPRTAVGATVLVVEPEFALRRVATIALERAGFTVCAAQDGVEAVELVAGRRLEIDCVLCALRMPRLDGWQTLEALRQLKPGIPVILTSGHNEAQAMAGKQVELPNAYLSKPYSFEALVSVLRQVQANAAAGHMP